ncbi:transcriptional regulator, TetR family [Bradyrhizobium erythrophlei]|jgi:PAS domain S-box-containing protein|nr:transcriptional regulator, TetR family [Bradyrhizobium erythrophlei]
MPLSQKHKDKTYTRLLSLASHYLKRQGPERLVVTKLMHAAGLTNGSFYSHFTSKEALLLGALEGAFNEAERIYRRVGDNLPPRQALTRFIDFYLSTYHRDSPSNCPIITLGSYLPRQSKRFRGTFDAGLKRLLDILADWLEAAGIPDGKRVAAAMLSAMAGTMVVARAVSDKGVSEDLLAVVRDNLKAQIGLGDLATVVKVSQTLSREIDLGNLIDSLMSLALEHAGADRGLLILPRGDELRIEAEARVVGGKIDVHLRQSHVAAGELPESVLRHVFRTQDCVLLDDVTGQNPYSEDDYFRRNQSQSILCLPLTRLGNLVGILYLENNLTRHVFTPARIAVLNLLASQAAVALQNARLYRDLAERESKIRRLVEANIIGIFFWEFNGRIIEANEEFLRIVGYDREDLASGRLRWTDLTSPERLDRDSLRWMPELKTTGSLQPSEKEYVRKDGSRVPVLIGVASFESGSEGVAFVLDLTERKRAEAAAREMQLELAHANRVATMGQLTASIAHEVKQPITAVITNAEGGLRWLSRRPLDLERIREGLGRIVEAGHRAGKVVDRIRALVRKAPPRNVRLNINEAILEVVELTRTEAVKNWILVQTDLAAELPLIEADRVQLQQVLLNLIVNAVEAMSGADDGRRELLISTREAGPHGVLVAVRDSGPGLTREAAEHRFDAFYTTKPDGLGMGLSICRSIIEAHGGRLWASANAPHGAIFEFSIPASPEIGG